MSKKRTCIEYRCNEQPHLGGLCKHHYEQERKEELERREAIKALNTRLVRGSLPEKDGLYEELTEASRWLDKANYALSNGIHDSVLQDETQFAPEWCIAIAKAIIDEEVAHREGTEADCILSHLKKLSWERFSNLQAGLMSNGRERSI